MEKVMALIMEVLLNNTELSNAIREIYGIEVQNIPDLSSDDTFEGKGRLIYNFLLDNKELLAIKPEVLDINIDELLDIINKLNNDSDMWRNPDDVFESITKLGLLTNVDVNDEVVEMMNNHQGLEQYVNDGIDIVIKKVPLLYRPVVKNKIKNKLLGGK